MSIPVSIEYISGPNGKNTYNACFYIESKYQKSPPTPTNPNLKIIVRKPVTIFTR